MTVQNHLHLPFLLWTFNLLISFLIFPEKRLNTDSTRK